MKQFFLFLFSIFAIIAQAQQPKLPNNPNYEKKTFHLGISLGFSKLDFRIDNSQSFLEPIGDKPANDSIFGVEADGKLGYQLEIITDLSLGKYFNLRFQPGIYLGQRNIEYQRKVSSSRNNHEYEIDIIQLSSVYISLPLLFKYKATRINNYRPYLLLGGAVLMDLDINKDDSVNEFYFLERKFMEYGIQFGAGIDWFMPYFKFGTEFRVHIGLNDVKIHKHANEYNTSIAGLYSKIFILALNFE